MDGDLLQRLNRAEAERDEATRLLGDLLGLVSHDLRNPLNAIAMAADELADPTLDPDQRERYVSAIRRSVSRGDRLIRDLVDVGRAEVGDLPIEAAPVTAGRLLEAAQQQHAPACADKEIELHVSVGADVELVVAERERILQVLGVLLDNAIRFTPRGGRIDLLAERVDQHVRFAVRDTGAGIASELLPHLFDPFGSKAAGRELGRRLGLILCRGIVSAHGGRIAASSDKGVGSEFSFTLPVPPA